MARVVNPQNLDDDDDAVFSALLSQGLIWKDDDEDGEYEDVEDDDEDDEKDVVETTLVYTQRVLQEAAYLTQQHGTEWLDLNRVSSSLNKKFGKIDLKRLAKPSKQYKSLYEFFDDYSGTFELRQDAKKPGQRWIRLKRNFDD